MTRIESRNVPQANSLSVVGNLLALASAGIIEKKRLSRELPLALREVDYYMHAARILGFAKFEKIQEFELTENGREYLSAETPTEKRRLLAQAVRSAKIFELLLKEHDESKLSRDEVATFLKDVTASPEDPRTKLNITTARRRADTIIAWLKSTRSNSEE